MQKWLLGLGGSNHDFSAALMCGNDIRVCIEAERLTRRKHGLAHWYENPLKKSIDYCLTAEGILIDQIDLIVSSDVLPARVRHDLRDIPVKSFPHHLCHAASAYMMLPPQAKAGVIVFDGYGSIVDKGTDPDTNLRETISLFVFGPEGYKRIGGAVGIGQVESDEFGIGVTNSIGMLYEVITGLLDFAPMESGKTMGLSSHGTPQYLNALEEFVTYGDDVSDCFRCATDEPALIARVEQILMAHHGSFSVKADLAASVQMLVNKTLLHCAGFFKIQNIDYLLVSGGCGLNTVANTFLEQHSTRGIPIVVPPHCGDAGLGLGAMWLHLFEKQGVSPSLTFRNQKLSPAISRPGRQYSKEEHRVAVQQFYPRIAIDASVSSPRDLARVLAQGAIVGVMNGRSEIGPRALGGRSILADPRSSMVREKINRLIKHREPFRPFAPIVLSSHYEKYFVDSRCADKFMLKTPRATDICRRDAPAIVHIDGTARVQVVAEDGDSFLIELLREFFEITGVGILLNTSFNRKGEPIVETPLDAIDAFLGMGLDGLYIDGAFYRSLGSINASI